MQTIKVNGVEIEFEDGTIEVEDGGKKIIFRGNETVEHHWHYAPVQTYPYQPFIYPINPLRFGTPILTCGNDFSTSANGNFSFTGEIK